MNRRISLWGMWAVLGSGILGITILSAAEEDLSSSKTAPPVRIELRGRNGDVTSDGSGVKYLSGGTIEVTQPRGDQLVIMMSGYAAAGGIPAQDSLAALTFQLQQDFRIVTSRIDIKDVKLSMEGSLIGQLQCNRPGSGTAAIVSPACAHIRAGTAELLNLSFDPRVHSTPNIKFINDNHDPVSIIVRTGDFTLTENFAIEAKHPKKHFKKNVAIAAFGPEGRAPDWLGLLDPYRDVPKQKDLGFRISLKVEKAPITKKLK